MADRKEERFGRLALETAAPLELLRAEAAHGRSKVFAALDALVGRFALRSLRGEIPFHVEGEDTRATGRPATLRLSSLSDEDRQVLDKLFSLEKQQARGSWSSRVKIDGRMGRLHFPHHLMKHGRFFHESVESDTYRPVSAEASPEALLAHTVLDPMFSSLYEPFVLRSGRAFPPSFDDSPEKAESSRERRRTRWQEVDTFFAALNLGVEPELSAVRPGGGWSRLRAAEQLSAKVALADAIRREAERVGPASLGARYRAFRLLPLLQRYYAKAKKDGRILRRRALTREYEATLSGFFGGDWLALLDYLGEEPHSDEHIATALPETRLYLTPSQEVDTKLGVESVSEEQLKLIATSLFGGETSPVERRLSALTRYWQAFDSLHTRQESGMEPLWGLVEDHLGFVLFRTEKDNSPHRKGLYRRALPDDLLDEIDELWGSAMSPREPARIVTDPFPHVRLAEIFGPALRFWHGCALTAWFLCEGPYSRTDMAGLKDYHSRALAELEDLGAPVDRSMFAELIAAETRLGEPQPTRTETREVEVEPGLVIETSMSHGSHREGFENLRDIITRHRRVWAEKHLQRYLSKRAENDVREAVKVFHVKSAERGGKPPTPKQFARTAAIPANRWFGGDVKALYRAFGERSPVSPVRVRIVPEDVESFVARVYAALGGVKVSSSPEAFDQASREKHNRKISDNHNKAELANKALEYLRLEETFGRPPTLKEFGKGGFEHRAAEAGLGAKPELAWTRYERIIRDVLLARTEGEPRDNSEQERAANRVQYGEIPYEAKESPEQPAAQESEAEGRRRTFDTEIQHHTESERETSSWWRRLFGR